MAVDLPCVHRFFHQNPEGRDFFVGDLHGQYHLLLILLDEVIFDPLYDRLFFVGDLIDRGESSEQCLRFIAHHCCHSVLGNHEWFLLHAADERIDASWYFNGGGWWQALTPVVQKELTALVIENYCLTLSVQTALGLVGVVHAEFPFDHWPMSRELAMSQAGFEMLWLREHIHNQEPVAVEGVEWLICGHTPISHVTRMGQQIYIDTGSGYQPKSGLPHPRLTFCQPLDGGLQLFSTEGKKVSVEFFPLL